MVFWPHLIPMLTIMREVVRVLWPAEDQSSWYSAWRWLTSPTWNLQKVIITLKKTDFLCNFIFKKVTSKNIFFVTLASELKIADNFLTINGNRQYGCFVSSLGLDLLRLSSVHITSLTCEVCRNIPDLGPDLDPHTSKLTQFTTKIIFCSFHP